MRILLTGAGGFIGGAVWATAIRRDFFVLPVFRSAPGSVVDEAACIQTVIDGNTVWEDALNGIDVIVHCAARAHVMNDNAEDPLARFRETNVAGTLNLARQAARAGVRRFVFISSIGVNGCVTAEQPFRPEDTPEPHDSHAISKWEAEQGLFKISEESGMEVVVIRPPMVYGQGVPGNLGRLVDALRKGWFLPLGAVHNRRTLIALDNLVDLILLCTRHPAAVGQVFLAGDAEDISTTDLLRRLGDALGKPARLLPVPVFVMEFAAGLLGKSAIVRKVCGNLQLDTTKTRELLGWVPPVSVDEGLRRCVGVASSDF